MPKIHRRQAAIRWLRSLLLFGLCLVLSMAPSFGQTFTVTLPAGSGVDQGDEQEVLPFTVTNTGTEAIDTIAFAFDAAFYDISPGTVPPPGWTATYKNAGNGQAVVTFSGGPLAGGASRVFELLLIGTKDGNFPAETADVTDRPLSVTALLGRSPRTLVGGLPTWTRFGLRSFLAVVPPSNAVGGTFTVTMNVANATTVQQVAIVPSVLDLSGTGTATLASGPSPATTGLAPGASADFVWTYVATGNGELAWSGTASNGFASSRLRRSNTVVVGDLTASLAIDYPSVVSGEIVNLTLTVTNNGALSVGQVQPGVPATFGSAGISLVGGPSPATVPFLGPHASAQFVWQYRVTGSVGADYSFSVGASSNGPISNTARSATGRITEITATVSPAIVASGVTSVANPTEFVVTLTNNGNFDLDTVVLKPSDPAFAYLSAHGGPGDSWTVKTVGPPVQIVYEVNPKGNVLGPGESAAFFATFSALPNPAANTDYFFAMEVYTGKTLRAIVPVTVTVTRFAIEVSATPATGTPANGYATVALTATVTEGGQPAAGVTVSFTASAGTLQGATAITDGAGQARITLTAPISAVDIGALVTASLVGSVGTALVGFTGYTEANLLYVGATLNPTSAQAGSFVQISLQVYNTSPLYGVLLSTATRLNFDDGVTSFSGSLDGATPVPSEGLATLRFSGTLSPALADSYLAPTLELRDGGAFVQSRTVQDLFHVINVTLVRLTEFHARGRGGAVDLDWVTGSEWGNAGFFVWRAESPDGERRRLHDELIPGLLSSHVGGSYVYSDTVPLETAPRYYWVEALDLMGRSTFHGPVCSDRDGDGLPDDWELERGTDVDRDDGDEDPDEDGLSNLEEYGAGLDPLHVDAASSPEGGASGLPVSRVEGTEPRGLFLRSHDGDSWVWELRSPDLDLLPRSLWGMDFFQAKIPGYFHGRSSEAGQPELPVKGLRFTVPSGRCPRLEILEVDAGEELFGWILPVPEERGREDGATAAVDESFQMSHATYGRDEELPGAAARLERKDGDCWQLRFHPLQVNCARKRIRLLRRIVLRITLEDASEPLLPTADLGTGALVSLALGDASALTEGLFHDRLVRDPARWILARFSAEGMARITAAELMAVSSLSAAWDVARIKGWIDGVELPLRIVDGGTPGRLDGSDFIEFHLPRREDKYDRTQVLYLSDDGDEGGRRMGQLVNASDAGAITPANFLCHARVEKNLRYWSEIAGPDDMDRWFFPEVISAADPDGVDFSVPVFDADPTAPEEARLEVEYVALAHRPELRYDHHNRISWNGRVLANFFWSGGGSRIVTASLGHDLLAASNQLRLEAFLDPGLTSDFFFLDELRLRYRRRFLARDDRLDFELPAGNWDVVIEGFSTDALELFELAPDGEIRALSQLQVESTSAGWRLRFGIRNPEARRYLALAAGDKNTADSLGLLHGTAWRESTVGADWVVVTREPFVSALAPLVTHRESQGLRTAVLTMEEVAESFGFGHESPEAIRAFLRHAAQGWQVPAPAYLLLVGDASSDPLGRGGATELHRLVPTALVTTDFGGETASDAFYERPFGGEGAPELRVGRLPFGSDSEISIVVSKIVAYENQRPGNDWEARGVFVADDGQRVFVDGSEWAASTLPAGFQVQKGYLAEQSASTVREALRGAWELGQLFVSFQGHGSLDLWAAEDLLPMAEISSLANAPRLPLVVSHACLDGYFIVPNEAPYPCLAERLLGAAAGGAVAVWSSSGISSARDKALLNEALYEALFVEGVRDLGQAILQARTALSASVEGSDDVLRSHVLFGDPALRLALPFPDPPEGLVLRLLGGGRVALSWSPSAAEDLAGYRVLRALDPAGPFLEVTTALLRETSWIDEGLEPGLSYFYRIEAVDLAGFTSRGRSALEVTAPATEGIHGGGCSMGRSRTVIPLEFVLALLAFMLGLRRRGRCLSR